DNVVFDLVSKRNDGCAQAIKFRRDQGKKVSIIKSVLQANALYSVEFTDSLDVDARLQATREIAGNLGLAAGVRDAGTIRGDGLFWGVRDDLSLADVSGTHPPPTGAGVRPRLLPTGSAAKIVSDINETR